MQLFKPKYIVLVLVIAGIFWMLRDSFTQQGTKDLKGNFIETAFYRNENNTGPVIRIYAVSTSDTASQQMIRYGNLMPHTKYGITKVYFFKSTLSAPSKLTGNSPNFDPKYLSNCIGVYEKNGMSKVSFSRTLN